MSKTALVIAVLLFAVALLQPAAGRADEYVLDLATGKVSKAAPTTRPDYPGERKLAEEYRANRAKWDAAHREAPAAGDHAHTCPKCWTVWWHGAENAGNEKAHRCPKCGELQYDVGVKRPASDCPT